MASKVALAALLCLLHGGSGVPRPPCRDPRARQNWERDWAGTLLRDPMSLLQPLEVRFNFSFWSPSKIKRADHHSSGLSVYLDEEECPRSGTCKDPCPGDSFPCGQVQVGRGGPDAQWFVPVSAHLQAARRVSRHLRADAELAVVCERFPHTPNVPTAFTRQDIRHIVVILRLEDTTSQDAGAGLGSSVLAERNGSLPGAPGDAWWADLRGLDVAGGHPEGLLAAMPWREALGPRCADAGAGANDTAWVALKLHPLPLPAPRLYRVLATDFDPLKVSAVYAQPVDLLPQYFPEPRQPKGRLHRRFWRLCAGMLAVALVALALTLAMVAVKNESIRTCQLDGIPEWVGKLASSASSLGSGGEDGGAVRATSSLIRATSSLLDYGRPATPASVRIPRGCLEARFVDSCVARPFHRALRCLEHGCEDAVGEDRLSQLAGAVVMAVNLVFFGILWCCVLSLPSSAGESGSRGPLSAGCHHAGLHWEWTLAGFLVWLFERAVDLLVFSRLQLKVPEFELCPAVGSFGGNSVPVRFCFSVVVFSTTYLEVVSASKVRMCEVPVMVDVEVIASCYFFLYLATPTACLCMDWYRRHYGEGVKHLPPKWLYLLAGMQLTLACVHSDKVSRAGDLFGDRTWVWVHGVHAALGCLPLCVVQYYLLTFRAAHGVGYLAIAVLCLLYHALSIWVDDIRWTLSQRTAAQCRRDLLVLVQRLAFSQGELREEDRRQLRLRLEMAGALDMGEDKLVLRAQAILRERGNEPALQAKRVSSEELAKELFWDACEGYAPAEAMQFAGTALACLGVLGTPEPGEELCRGGALIVVLSPSLSNKVHCPLVGHGFFMRALNELLRGASVCEGPGQPTEGFRHALRAFCAHTDSDRWGEKEVEYLESCECFRRRLSDEVRDGLVGEPMDGAIVIDFAGKIRHASVKLGHEQERWSFHKANGKGAGTRHRGALGAAVWLSDRGLPYAVLVRSDGGGLHCLTGGGCGSPPQVRYVDCCEQGWLEEVLKDFDASSSERKVQSFLET